MCLADFRLPSGRRFVGIRSHFGLHSEATFVTLNRPRILKQCKPSYATTLFGRSWKFGFTYVFNVVQDEFQTSPFIYSKSFFDVSWYPQGFFLEVWGHLAKSVLEVCGHLAKVHFDGR